MAGFKTSVLLAHINALNFCDVKMKFLAGTSAFGCIRERSVRVTVGVKDVHSGREGCSRVTPGSIGNRLTRRPYWRFVTRQGPDVASGRGMAQSTGWVNLRNPSALPFHVRRRATVGRQGRGRGKAQGRSIAGADFLLTFPTFPAVIWSSCILINALKLRTQKRGSKE